jgi:hypothetical protein
MFCCCELWIFMFRYGMKLPARAEQTAVAVSFSVGVPVKPVSNNRLSWLKCLVCSSQLFRKYVETTSFSLSVSFQILFSAPFMNPAVGRCNLIYWPSTSNFHFQLLHTAVFTPLHIRLRIVATIRDPTILQIHKQRIVRRLSAAPNRCTISLKVFHIKILGHVLRYEMSKCKRLSPCIF